MIGNILMPEISKENEVAPEDKEISITCWDCNKDSSQRWAIDPNYIVCPQCLRLYQIKKAGYYY